MLIQNYSLSSYKQTGKEKFTIRIKAKRTETIFESFFFFFFLNYEIKSKHKGQKTIMEITFYSSYIVVFAYGIYNIIYL